MSQNNFIKIYLKALKVFWNLTCFKKLFNAIIFFKNFKEILFFCSSWWKFSIIKYFLLFSPAHAPQGQSDRIIEFDEGSTSKQFKREFSFMPSHPVKNVLYTNWGGTATKKSSKEFTKLSY